MEEKPPLPKGMKRYLTVHNISEFAPGFEKRLRKELNIINVTADFDRAEIGSVVVYGTEVSSDEVVGTVIYLKNTAEFMFEEKQTEIISNLKAGLEELGIVNL